MILTDKNERMRFFRFAIVGIIGAVVDFGIFNILHSIVALAIVWASGISFIAAVVSNFLWNRYWTYPESKTKKITRQLIQFVSVSLIGLGIRSLTITPLENFLNQVLDNFNLHVPIKNSVISANLSLAILIIVVMFWNFFANRYWTYNNVVLEESNP